MGWYSHQELTWRERNGERGGGREGGREEGRREGRTEGGEKKREERERERERERRISINSPPSITSKIIDIELCSLHNSLSAL